MICLNKEELLKNIDLNELKQYMLYNLKTSNNGTNSKNLTFINNIVESTNSLENNIETNNSNANSNANANVNANVNKANNFKKQNIF